MATDSETETTTVEDVYGSADEPGGDVDLLKELKTTREYGGPSRPRPRFSTDHEDVELDLPAGKSIGRCIAVAASPVNGDLFLLNYGAYGPYSQDPDSRLNWIVRVDRDGQYLNDFGGSDDVPTVEGVNQWLTAPDNVECDDEGNVWVTGFHPGDDVVLKFSPEGEFMRHYGQRGRPGSNSDKQYVKAPPSVYHDVANRELFVADGYGNNRVIAFDSETGEFTRMWGAFGQEPSELSPEEGFGNPVHKVACAPDGLIYVADRTKNRVQEFELVPDGVRYIREVKIAPGTYLMGSAFDLAFTPDNKYMYVCDGMGTRVWTVGRATFEVLGWSTAAPRLEGEDNIGLTLIPLHRFALLGSGDLLLAGQGKGIQRMRHLGVK